MSIAVEHTAIKAPSTYQDWLVCFDMMKNVSGADTEVFDAACMGSFVGSDLTKNALQKQIVETVNAFLDKSVKRFIRNLNENIAFNELSQTELLIQAPKKGCCEVTVFYKAIFSSKGFSL